MSETIKKLNMIAEWQEQHKQLIEDLDNSKKRIAELEKQLAISEHDREHNDYELTEVYGKVAELEKENAELKTDYKVLSCSVGDFGELQDKLEEEQRKNIGLSDNLTKAKELLGQWLTTSYAGGCNNINIVEDTKRFIEAEQ